MVMIRPFQAVRPAEGKAAQIAALPYDVYDKKGARQAVCGRPLSFLNIDRPETLLSEDTDMYAPEVYAAAAQRYKDMKTSGDYIQDEKPCFYLYAQTMGGRTQTGLVSCVSVDEYLRGNIRRHENTLAAKEQDRIRHIDALSAQTGPIFLTCRSKPQLKELIRRLTLQAPLYDFVSEDHIGHRVWKISDPQEIEALMAQFSELSALYIADGHHRAASAVKVCEKRRAEHPGYTGQEEFNYFLSVIFPDDELKIYDYNRVVSDLNGMDFGEFCARLEKSFTITALPRELDDPRPKARGEIAMYCENHWYRLTLRPDCRPDDPVEGLDVSVLQNEVLSPLLGIADPKNSDRIAFFGGIYGPGAVRAAVDGRGQGVGFMMYPTSMEELLNVADAGRLMPPKSTWFEPKLRSGLFIHEF